MGNASTREASSPYQQGHSRSASSSSRYRSGSTNDARNSNPLLGGNGAGGSGSGGGSAYSTRRERDRDRDANERARNLEHALLGLGIVGSSRSAERSARNREEEREAREQRKREREIEKEKERQRSLREESCDGGFLVTQGVYTGPQDFKEKVVRHLMLERKLAPFWKGLPDHEDDWTDAQLVAAVKGLPIPGPEAECEPEISPLASPGSETSPIPNASDSALHLTVPTGTRSRSHSYTSDSSSRSGNIVGSSVFRARSKTINSAPSNPVETVSTTNPLETNLTGRYIDGRPIEAVLYKHATECPICFLYYPPYMNRTRCCDYDICTECFVQIKRADPHLPHDQEPQSGGSQEPTNPDLLISEPASCPFCKEPDFGVVYTPPPFRRGLVYTDSLAPSYIGAATFSPDSSTPQSPDTPSSPPAVSGERRKTALATTAAEVVLTDQIRPDWAHKLQSARNQAARRAAAATALHNAAFLLSNTTRETGSTGGSSGSFASRRLMRRGGIPHGSESPSPGGSGTGTPRAGERAGEAVGLAGLGLLGLAAAGSNSGSLRMGSTTATGGQGTTGQNDSARGTRRTRMVDLEEMMLREAIRLSILEEEARKAKEEQDKKKKEEEERLKAAREGNVAIATASTDGGGEGNSSASGKGKTVDRSVLLGASAAGSSKGIIGGEQEREAKNSTKLPINPNGKTEVSSPQPHQQASSGDVKKAEAGIHVDEGEIEMSR